MEVNFGDNSFQESEVAHERCSLKWAKMSSFLVAFQAFSLQIYLKMNSLKAIFKDFD